MSLYARSWLFTGWVLLVFFTVPTWSAFMERIVGPDGLWLVAAFWLGHAFVPMFLLKCPDCGLSPFASSKKFIAWHTTWPRRICGHCGHDHRRTQMDG
ncbi:hypothetical protein A7Q26_22650 [Sphingobium sp. TCM1]|nr:hypothetical protein A7Q26_22650 [Sphingobium sp. TCM1]